MTYAKVTLFICAYHSFNFFIFHVIKISKTLRIVCTKGNKLLKLIIFGKKRIFFNVN